MIIDVTGVELTPGNHGKDCLGHGDSYYEDGEPIECCCDECDFMMCCLDDDWQIRCANCKHDDCPRKEPQG